MRIPPNRLRCRLVTREVNIHMIQIFFKTLYKTTRSNYVNQYNVMYLKICKKYDYIFIAFIISQIEKKNNLMINDRKIVVSTIYLSHIYSFSMS